MRKIITLCIVSFCTFLHAVYVDDELTELWSSLSDINDPTREDYKKMEKYLKEGKRPYLDILRKSLLTRKGLEPRLNQILNFKFIGPNNEKPQVEVYGFNINKRTKDRCICLFASYNGIYPEKARAILSEIHESGYSGYVLLRIGGYPNVENGGLKISHVPWAFKAAALREAQAIGFKEVLWLDTAIHPMTNFESIFHEMKQKGYFFTTVSTLKGNEPNHLLEAAKALRIDYDLYDVIPHISSAILGIDTQNPRALKLLDEWYAQMENVYPNMTWFPEELSLSVTAWRLNCTPHSWIGKIMCLENELDNLDNRPDIQFYLDGVR